MQRKKAPRLRWEVFVTPGVPIVTPDPPPDTDKTYFQPTAATLIYGTEEAVLVDAFMTADQANSLADWVALKGKTLKAIYITHGRGDHWFGLGTLLQRFPKAKALATRHTVEVMRQNSSPKALHGVWMKAFPGRIPNRPIVAKELKADAIELEGYQLVVVGLGHTDTEHTTCLYVPSIGLVVAGDAVYNDVHLYLAESNTRTRQEWMSALNKIDLLKPRAVVASHKRPDNGDPPTIVEETRRYIRDFNRLLEVTKTARELYDRMLELYPHRVNPGWALWSSARAFKP